MPKLTDASPVKNTLHGFAAVMILTASQLLCNSGNGSRHAMPLVVEFVAKVKVKEMLKPPSLLRTRSKSSPKEIINAQRRSRCEESQAETGQARAQVKSSTEESGIKSFTAVVMSASHDSRQAIFTLGRKNVVIIHSRQN